MGITVAAARVNRLVLKVSGRNKDKTERYAPISDRQLLDIELAEARRGDAYTY